MALYAQDRWVTQAQRPRLIAKTSYLHGCTCFSVNFSSVSSLTRSWRLGVPIFSLKPSKCFESGLGKSGSVYMSNLSHLRHHLST
jgi:hypothetical protein